MNRRAFLKALTALVGAATVTPAFAASIPETVPDDWLVTIGSMEGDTFCKYASVKVASIEDQIEFPMWQSDKPIVISHVCVNGQIVPLRSKVVLTRDCIPRFPAGRLVVTED